MFRLRGPYVAPIHLVSARSVVAGPFEFISRMFTPAPGRFLAVPRVTAKLSSAKMVVERGEPAWYVQARNTLDSTMNGVVNETAAHGYDRFAEDVFYLDRLIERLRAWDKQLLLRADAVRAKKPFS